jgi:2-hydroxy-3-oxopropionate reductase
VARVGFIGLGLMGSHMARNVLRAGHDLTVHSRSPAPVDALVAEGASRGSSPAEVASRTEVIVTMLPDTPDVELVLFGPDGIADTVAGGSLVIDMSTIDPIATRRFAERMSEVGVGMIDAPVSGGDIGARDATLSIMVGGTEADVTRARPLFEAMGKNIVHVGASGAGQIAKACNQLVLAGTLEAVGEALVLAAKAGVSPAKVREALLGGFAASRVLEVHGQRMLDGDFAPGFRAELMLKDARIVVAAAHELGVSIPTFERIEAELARLVRDRGGEVDYSALVTLREDDAGVDVRHKDRQKDSPPV